MRVYELARLMGLPSVEVVALLRANGEWVSSHLSLVTKPVADRYTPDQSATVDKQPSSRPPLSPPTAISPLRLAPRLKYRQRPGPRPLTLRQLAYDEFDEPIDDLRYGRVTTRDVAESLHVTQATVRRWVARGYIHPVGKHGLSNVFDGRDVLAAYDEIKDRRKATGHARREDRYQVELRPSDRIRPKYYDAIVDIKRAAELVDVSPATIRSWIHRGHLIPLRSSKPRAIQLRLGDVVTAARSRKLPQRAPLRVQRRSHSTTPD